MPGSRSPPKTPKLTSAANININITATGKAATDQATQIANNPEWQNKLNQARNASNNAGHSCGPGRFGGSRDSDTVADLENYVNNNRNDRMTNLLEQHANDLYDSVNYAGGECWKYWSGLEAEAARIRGPDTDKLNTDHGNNINTYTNTIDELGNFLNKRQVDLVAKKAELATKQTELTTKQAELTTKNGYLSKITNVKIDATSNVNVLNDYKDALTENIKTNAQFGDYLSERVKITHDVGSNNYEELYKAVILQNEILENTKNELNSNIVSSDRKSELISNKKDFVYSMYVKLRIMYFLLLVLFLIFLIFLQKGWSVYFKFFLFCIAAIYPYVINYIEDYIYNTARFLLAIISGAVYTYHNIQ